MLPAIAAGQAKVTDVIAGYNDGFVWASPVGSFAANQFGLFDMGGNVSQWCEDWFDLEHTKRVMRGANWSYGYRRTLLSSGRNAEPPDSPDTSRGFRCVLAPVPPVPAAN